MAQSVLQRPDERIRALADVVSKPAIANVALSAP